MQIHPLCDLFPAVKGEEFDKLVADVKSQGLLNPIILLGDVLLDGRNRRRACEKAGVPLRTVQFESLGLKCTPEDFIWSQNVSRRHLTDDQRTIIAAQWSDEIRKLAKERQREHGGTAPGKSKNTFAESGKSVPHTREAIADRAKVSKHKAWQAEAVHKNAPELESKVASGEMKLRDAAKIASTKKKTNKRQTQRFSLELIIAKLISALFKVLRKVPAEHRIEFKKRATEEFESWLNNF